MKKLGWIFILVFSLGNRAFGAGPTFCGDKLIVGHNEKIRLEKNIAMNAKFDTGASMSSLSAQHIKLMKQGNSTWVKFTIYSADSHKPIVLTKKLRGTTRILKRAEENHLTDLDKQYAIRPVIRLTVCIGNEEKTILVNLANRTQFYYPMLVGSAAIKQFQLLVDASRHALVYSHCTHP